MWLELRFTKKQILSIYLNRVYLGSGTYGVQAASEKYFNKKVEDLNLYESSVIASLFKAPSRYNPIANKKLSQERASLVLENMVKNKMISEPKLKRQNIITKNILNLLHHPKVQDILLIGCYQESKHMLEKLTKI